MSEGKLIEITLWSDMIDGGLRLELGHIACPRDFHEDNPSSFSRVTPEVEKMIASQIGDMTPQSAGEVSHVHVANLVVPKGSVPTPERLAQRLHAAQATLAVLMPIAHEVANQLDPLEDEWDDAGVAVGPAGGPLARLPHAIRSAMRAADKAEERIDAALDLTCQALEES